MRVVAPAPDWEREMGKNLVPMGGKGQDWSLGEWDQPGYSSDLPGYISGHTVRNLLVYRNQIENQTGLISCLESKTILRERYFEYPQASTNIPVATSTIAGPDATLT